MKVAVAFAYHHWVCPECDTQNCKSGDHLEGHTSPFSSCLLYVIHPLIIDGYPSWSYLLKSDLLVIRTFLNTQKTSHESWYFSVFRRGLSLVTRRPLNNLETSPYVWIHLLIGKFLSSYKIAQWSSNAVSIMPQSSTAFPSFTNTSYVHT